MDEINSTEQQLLYIKKKETSEVLQHVSTDRQSKRNSPGRFIVSGIAQNQSARDNTDLKIDTPNGRNQLQGTAIIVYQKKRNFISSTKRIYWPQK